MPWVFCCCAMSLMNSQWSIFRTGWRSCRRTLTVTTPTSFSVPTKLTWKTTLSIWLKWRSLLIYTGLCCFLFILCSYKKKPCHSGIIFLLLTLIFSPFCLCCLLSLSHSQLGLLHCPRMTSMNGASSQISGRGISRMFLGWPRRCFLVWLQSCPREIFIWYRRVWCYYVCENYWCCSHKVVHCWTILEQLQ